MNFYKRLSFILIGTLLVESTHSVDSPVHQKNTKLKIAMITTATAIASFLAYKKSDIVKRKVDYALDETRDYFISHVLCPIVIKWETLKEEKLSKKDAAYIALTLCAASIGLWGFHTYRTHK